MKAFLTGSVVYGIPSEKSDIDLVVLTDEHTKNVLACDGFPIRFGCLNLILLTDEEQWAIWKKGTEDLEKIKPVSRETAVAHFQFLGVTQTEEFSKPTQAD